MGVARVLRGAIAAALTALVAGLLAAVPVAAADDNGGYVYGYVYWQGNTNNTVIGTLRVSPRTWEAGDPVRLTLDYTLPTTEYHACGQQFPDMYYGGLLIRVGWSDAVGSSTFSGASPGMDLVDDQGPSGLYNTYEWWASGAWHTQPRLGPGAYSVTATAPSSTASPRAYVNATEANWSNPCGQYYTTSSWAVPAPNPSGLAVTIAQSPERLVLGRDNDQDGDVDEDDATLELRVKVENVTDVPVQDVEATGPVEITQDPALEDALEPLDEEPVETGFGTLQPGASKTLAFRYKVTGRVDAEAKITVRGIRNGASVTKSGTGMLEAGQVVAPVVFLPGVLGSEIWCAPNGPLDRIWPPATGALESPGTFGWPVQEQLMLLTADGTANASSECSQAGPRDAEYDEEHHLVPGTSGVVESVGPVDAYGAGMGELARIVGPENFYAFGWDWRKDTAASLDRLDTLVDQAIEEARENQELADDDEDPKVQLVAHSYGGLLALDYASDPGRRDKLERVTTVGTPYLGAPKTAFSLLTGTESAIANGWSRVTSMQTIFGGSNDVRSFAATARGLYNLWPAASYGRFLDVAGVGSPLDDGQIRDLITAAGGVPEQWDAAQAKHAALWDRLDIDDLPWHMVVSGGVPTISRVRFEPGGTDTPLTIGIELSAGDGTVPLPSQTMLAATGGGVDTGTIGGAHPKLSLGELCAVEHGSQMAAPGLYAQIEDWLLLGESPESGTACRAEKAVVIDAVGSTLNLTETGDEENPDMPDPFGSSASPRLARAVTSMASTSAASASATTAAVLSTAGLSTGAAGTSVLTVRDAEKAGLVTVLRSTGRALIMLDPGTAMRLRLDPAPGKVLRVSTSVVDGSVTTPLAAPVAHTGPLYVVSDGAGGVRATTTIDTVTTPAKPPFDVCTSRIAPAAKAKPAKMSTKPAKKRIEKNKRGKVVVTVSYKKKAKGKKKTLKATGTVVLCEGTTKLAQTTLKKGKKNVKLPKLKPGKHKLTVRYLGSGKTQPKDKTVVIKVKR